MDILIEQEAIKAERNGEFDRAEFLRGSYSDEIAAAAEVMINNVMPESLRAAVLL